MGDLLLPSFPRWKPECVQAANSLTCGSHLERTSHASAPIDVQGITLPRDTYQLSFI